MQNLRAKIKSNPERTLEAGPLVMSWHFESCAIITEFTQEDL